MIVQEISRPLKHQRGETLEKNKYEIPETSPTRYHAPKQVNHALVRNISMNFNQSCIACERFVDVKKYQYQETLIVQKIKIGEKRRLQRFPKCAKGGYHRFARQLIWFSVQSLVVMPSERPSDPNIM